MHPNRKFGKLPVEKNEIYKAYGTEYKEMTMRLLEKAQLCNEIKNSNARIAIKPNLVTSSPAKFGGTTHTEVVAGIIEYLQQHGFMDITVAEGSWVGDLTREAFEYCGYNRLAAEYGVKLSDMQEDAFFEKDCGGMKLRICSFVNDIDFLINVPVLKGHCQTRITCALKNMKGLIPNSEKRRFHSMGLHKPIAHLNCGIRQDFIVIDHICGDPDFEEGGNPLVRNCVMAAKDPVLVDAYTASILGYEPQDIDYVMMAEELGVGSADLSRLRIITTEGENCEDLPDTHKILEVNYAVDEVDSCSACYGMLIAALTRLKEDGLLDELDGKIAIGQGHAGKTGKCGVGNCTSGFEFNIPGCPPEADDIYTALRDKIIDKRVK